MLPQRQKWLPIVSSGWVIFPASWGGTVGPRGLVAGGDAQAETDSIADLEFRSTDSGAD